MLAYVHQFTTNLETLVPRALGATTVTDHAIEVALRIFVCLMVILRPGREKSLKEIQSEIQAIIRQITSSVSFLPMIDEPCTYLGNSDANTRARHVFDLSACGSCLQVDSFSLYKSVVLAND